MKMIQVVDPSYETMQEIVKIEEEAFNGKGNVDLWIIKALIRYGIVFVIKIDEEIVSIIEYMQSFNEKKVFLYGISTLKKYRCKGYASFLLKESEKYLKNLNFKEIELTVDPNNRIAINMYEKNKYIKYELLENEYGLNINRYVMRKKI